MLTEEMLAIAEQNGISRENVYQRIRKYHWSEEKAITEPVLGSRYEEYRELAKRNGISKKLFCQRIYKGMSPEDAATSPKQGGSKEFAVYNGDDLLVVGTANECAEYLGVDPKTVRFYTTPTYQRRLAKRKNPRNYRTVIKLDEE